MDNFSNRSDNYLDFLFQLGRSCNFLPFSDYYVLCFHIHSLIIGIYIAGKSLFPFPHFKKRGLPVKKGFYISNNIVTHLIL